MDKDLINYIIWNCRNFMFNEEVKALTQLGLAEEVKNEMLEEYESEKASIFEDFYGFDDEKVDKLVALGEEKLKEKIAARIFAAHEQKIINLCPRCGKLTRTPKAKQCRFCFYDWH